MALPHSRVSASRLTLVVIEKMKNKESLKKFAFEINDLLSEYIKLHDRILKEGGAFISLFKRVDFEKMFTDCGNLLRKFKIKKEELISLEQYGKANFDSNEKKYFEQLIFFLKNY